MTAGTQRTRVNASGQLIPSNFGVTVVSESLVRCDGCGREFSASRMRDSSMWVDAQSRYGRNRGRAMAHADKCRGKQP
jgi:hypothetical protein